MTHSATGVVALLNEMMERVKGRIGIYGTGWNPQSVMGLLLPFLIVILFGVIGWLFISAVG